MSVTYTLSPHILTSDDGRILCLPTKGDTHQAVAVFANKDVADELAPKGFYPLYVSLQELQGLSEGLHVWLVALIGLGGDLEGSVFTTDAFVGALEGEL